LIRFGDQTASKVFLQGLMRARRSLPQDSVGVFRNVFYLHTGHGAIMAPIAPQYKYWEHRGGTRPRPSADSESLSSQEIRGMPICPPHSDKLPRSALLALRDAIIFE
jgi:hypothetical protein